MAINKSIIIKEGKKARNKPPAIFGNCDYIAREFSKQLIQNYDIERDDIELLVVHVKNNGKSIQTVIQ
jgi:hypothetical protein